MAEAPPSLASEAVIASDLRFESDLSDRHELVGEKPNDLSKSTGGAYRLYGAVGKDL